MIPPPPPRENIVKRVGATTAFLADASRRRPGGRQVIWSGIVLMSAVGLFLMSWPFATKIWADRIQNSKEKQFASAQLREAYQRDVQIPEGGALTRLQIPKLKVDVIVVEGVTGNALRAGAGHYPGTSLPGEIGNVAIAGHRTGFGQPFRYLDKLKQGDKIILRTPVGVYTYAVSGDVDGHRNPWITHPIDWTVIAATPTPTLTLTTCDPPHTQKMRLIVRADLIDTQEVS